MRYAKDDLLGTDEARSTTKGHGPNMEFPFEFILVLGLAFMCKLAEVLNIDPEVY